MASSTDFPVNSWYSLMALASPPASAAPLAVGPDRRLGREVSVEGRARSRRGWLVLPGSMGLGSGSVTW